VTVFQKRSAAAGNDDCKVRRGGDE